MSVESVRRHYFVMWLVQKFPPLCQLIRLQTKTDCDSVSRVFPRFGLFRSNLGWYAWCLDVNTFLLFLIQASYYSQASQVLCDLTNKLGWKNEELSDEDRQQQLQQKLAEIKSLSIVEDGWKFKTKWRKNMQTNVRTGGRAGSRIKLYTEETELVWFVSKPYCLIQM